MSMINEILAAEWVMNIAFQTLLILGMGVAIVTMMRRRATPLRSGVCLITMLALVLLPFLSVSLNELGFMPLKTVLPITLESAPSASISITYSPQEIPLAGNEGENSQNASSIWNGSVAVKVINVFGLIWGIGIFIMLLRLALGAIAIHNMKKGMAQVEDSRVLAVLSSVKKVFSRQTRARVFVSQKVPYPMAVGLFRPVVLVPQNYLDQLKNSQIRAILLHELSHIYHGDLATGVLQRLVTALNWWNPLAYVLSSAFSRAREEIADNHALLQNDSKEYAECLLDLAEKTSLLRRLSVSVGLASPHIPLEDRIKNILSKERIMETKLKKSTIALMAVSAFLFLAAVAGSRLIFASDKPAVTTEKVDMASSDLLTQEQQNKEKEQKSTKKDVKPAKLIKKVDPVYPDEARKAEIEGTVTLEATTDNQGRVQKIKILNSVPGLDQAAIDAVKQWVYEPMLIDGKPYGVIFTTTCRFSLKEGKHATSREGGVTGTDQKPAVPAMGTIKPPKLIKKVDPVYPQEAKDAGIEGVVIVEATTDIYGRVVNTKILRSIPALDQSAIDAIKQWVYEPMIIGGEPRGVIFTVTCSFKLDDQEEPVRAIGDIKPPKLIKKVDPVYPQEAKDAGIEGVVILEATTDKYGRVVATRVLRSIPELDQAAIDAVKQWVYEPMIIDGKPIGVIFTVTVTFRLE